MTGGRDLQRSCDRWKGFAEVLWQVGGIYCWWVSRVTWMFWRTDSFGASAMHLLKVQAGGVSYLCPGSWVYHYFVDRYFEDLIFLPLSCFDLTGTQGHLHLPSPHVSLSHSKIRLLWFKRVCHVQCALFTVWCTVHIYYVVCSSHCIMCNVQCTLYTVPCTTHVAYHTIHTVYCVMHNQHCIMCSVQPTLYALC